MGSHIFRFRRSQLRLLGAAGLAFGLFTGGSVLAADLDTGSAPSVPPLSPEWSFVIAPYFWAAGLSGTTANFGAPAVDTDVSFSDIINSLDFSMMVAGEARRGRFSIYTDLLYLKTTMKNATPHGILASTAKVGAKTFEMTALAGYALVDNDRVRLDLVGGARLWSIDNALSFQGGFLDGRKFEDSATWVDAMGGLKGRFNMTERAYLTGWALAGAGGSDLGWDLLGGLGYDFNDRFSAVLGYRAAAVDYQSGSFEYDVTIQGPIAGLAIRF